LISGSRFDTFRPPNTLSKREYLLHHNPLLKQGRHGARASRVSNA